MSLSLIVAIAQNGAIGKDNNLLWHISNDLKRFKQLTNGKKIIAGRKTFESLPKLPNRKIIVVTKNKDYKIIDTNIEVRNNLANLLSEYKSSPEEVFIIGGKDIYEKSISYCEKLYITEVYKDFLADVYLNLDYSNFEKVNESEIYIDEKTNLKYKFIDYRNLYL